MLQNRKSTGTFLLAGLAAFAYYKYSKMSAEQKKNIVGDLKDKGRKLYDQYAPQEVKDLFENKGTQSTTNNNFGNGSSYTG
jgi:hypothetical protein